MNYLYVCAKCGPFESQVSGDVIQCRCGHTARRRWAVSIDRTSLKQSGRWDPVVGRYVSGDREFRSALAEGQEKQSETLGMDVKLATVDARDHSALAELHGRDVNEYQQDAAKVRFDANA